MINHEELAQTMDAANIAVAHLTTRGQLSPLAQAALIQLEVGVARLIDSNEFVAYLASERIKFAADRLFELSGLETLKANRV